MFKFPMYSLLLPVDYIDAFFSNIQGLLVVFLKYIRLNLCYSWFMLIFLYSKDLAITPFVWFL